jgi:hypothetical protein
VPADDARPTVEDLVTAAREFLQTALLPDVPVQHAYHLRVTINVLGMVERELADRGAAAASHARHLLELGYHDDADLADAIRNGTVPAAQLPDVIRAVRSDVLARLELADPSYLTQYSA